LKAVKASSLPLTPFQVPSSNSFKFIFTDKNI
jgi:hypothetical protein